MTALLEERAAADLPFGAPVSFTRHLRRRWVTREGKHLKAWVPEASPDETDSAPRAGIVVGVRTLANGTVRNMYEDGLQFEAVEHFTAYLVAFDLRRKPVLVLPEHVQRTEATR